MLRAVTQLCPTLCEPMDCSPPGSSVSGIFQTRILEWFAISSSRGSSWPRDWTWASSIGRWILYHWATWEALSSSIRELLWGHTMAPLRWSRIWSYIPWRLPVFRSWWYRDCKHGIWSLTNGMYSSVCYHHREFSPSSPVIYLFFRNKLRMFF